MTVPNAAVIPNLPIIVNVTIRGIRLRPSSVTKRTATVASRLVHCGTELLWGGGAKKAGPESAGHTPNLR